MHERPKLIISFCLVLGLSSLFILFLIFRGGAPVLSGPRPPPPTTLIMTRQIEYNLKAIGHKALVHMHNYKRNMLLYLSSDGSFLKKPLILLCSDVFFLLLMKLFVRKKNVTPLGLRSSSRRFSFLMAVRILLRAFISFFFGDMQIFPHIELLVSLLVSSIYVHVHGVLWPLFSLICLNVLLTYLKRKFLIAENGHRSSKPTDQNSTCNDCHMHDRVARLELGNRQPPLHIIKSPARAYGASLLYSESQNPLLHYRYSITIERRELNWVRFADISHNRFEAIPGAFSDFEQLQWIVATGNPITILDVSTLPSSLIGLSLDNCKLAIVNWDESTVCSLRYLNISNNALLEVPDVPLDAPLLEIIDLSGNPKLEFHFENFISKMPNLKVIIFPDGSQHYLNATNSIKLLNLRTSDDICNYLCQFHPIAPPSSASNSIVVNGDDAVSTNLHGGSVRAAFTQLLFIALIFQPLLFGIFFDPASMARPMPQIIPIKLPMLSQLQLLRRLPPWRHGFVLPCIVSAISWLSAWYYIHSRTDYFHLLDLQQEGLLSVSLSLLIGIMLLSWSLLYRNPSLYIMQAFAPAISQDDEFANSVAVESIPSVVLDIVDLQRVDSSSEAYIEYCSMRIWVPLGKSCFTTSYAMPASTSLKLGKSGLFTQQAVDEAKLRFGSNLKRIEAVFWPFFWNLILTPSNFFFLFLSGFQAMVDSSSIDGSSDMTTFILPVMTFVFPVLSRAFMEIGLRSSKYDIFAMIGDLYRFIPHDATRILVKREGRKKYISHSELLPGDIAFLQETGIVPADMVIIEGQGVISEAMLTGESIPMQKTAAHAEILDAILNGRKRDVAGVSKYILYDGTFVQAISSRATSNRYIKAIVLATGFSTRKGSIVQTIRIGTSRVSATGSAGQLSMIATMVAVVSIASIYLKTLILKLVDHMFELTNIFYTCYLRDIFKDYLPDSWLLKSGDNDSMTLFEHSGGNFSIWFLFSSSLLSVSGGKIYLAGLFDFTHHVAMKLFSMTDKSSGFFKEKKKGPIPNGMQITCTDLSRLELAASIDICCFDKTGTLTESEMDYVGWLDPSVQLSPSDIKQPAVLQKPSPLNATFSCLWSVWNKTATVVSSGLLKLRPKKPKKTSFSFSSFSSSFSSFWFSSSPPLAISANKEAIRLTKRPNGQGLASNARLVIGSCHSLFEMPSSSGSKLELLGSPMEKFPFMHLGWTLHTPSSDKKPSMTQVVTDDGVVIDIVRIFPKDSSVKRMMVIGKIGYQYFVAMKGAPDVLLSQFRWSTEAEKASYLQQTMVLGSSGYRIMALALKWLPFQDDVDGENDHIDFASITDPMAVEALIGIEGDSLFSYLGMVAFESTPKDASLDTLRVLRNTGHQTIMITGDSTETATAVGHQLEFFSGKQVLLVNLESISSSSDDQLQLSVKFEQRHVTASKGSNSLAKLLNSAEIMTPYKLYKYLSRNTRLVLSNSAFSALVEWNEAFFTKKILPQVSVFARSTPDNKVSIWNILT